MDLYAHALLDAKVKEMQKIADPFRPGACMQNDFYEVISCSFKDICVEFV